MLKKIEYERSESIRRRMEEAGCVFEFVSMAVSDPVAYGHTMHLEALEALRIQILDNAMSWHRLLLADPRFSNRPEPTLTWNVEQAKPRHLQPEEVKRLQLMDEPSRGQYSLHGAFIDPPYPTKFACKEDADCLYREWLDILGIDSGQSIEVIDWVSTLDLEWIQEDQGMKTDEPWSDYFKDGLEWWGVWCLTIWNPERQILSALAASSTD